MPSNENPRQSRKLLLIALLAVACFGALFAATTVQPATEKPQEVAFSAFLQSLGNDKVKTARISTANQVVSGEMEGERNYKTTFPADFPLTERLELADVPFFVERHHSSNTNMFVLIGIVGFIAVMILVARSRGSQRSGSGAPGRMIEAGEIPVTFDDVAGVDEVVEELSEIKGFLADPERFREIGATIPKGVLLFGPPGTGKTLLARAVAGEANVPFFSISGSDFVEMYVGVGASRVRKLFETAKQHAPCVVFIDEIDAVGRKRGNSAQGGQEERENTLNQLLVEMDGFAPTDNVIVMAASNRADILDPALTRPGRFDRQVIVDCPDRPGRRAILDVHSKNKPFAVCVDLDAVAAQTAGFAGADLANLVNEAALLAARHDRKEIINSDIDEAIMRVMAGPQKNRLMTDREKRVTAAHEMGHAIVAHMLEDAEPVHKVTIVGRGRALGLTVMLQEEDKLLRTRTELMSQMAVALGGRVAEELMFGEITTGASNDLEKVNDIAQTMILKLGMSDRFALRSFVTEGRMSVHSDGLSQRLDNEIDSIVHEAKLRAKTILEERRGELEHLTELLIEVETIDREEFELLMNGPAKAEASEQSDELDVAGIVNGIVNGAAADEPKLRIVDGAADVAA